MENDPTAAPSDREKSVRDDVTTSSPTIGTSVQETAVETATFVLEQVRATRSTEDRMVREKEPDTPSERVTTPEAEADDPAVNRNVRACPATSWMVDKVPLPSPEAESENDERAEYTDCPPTRG